MSSTDINVRGIDPDYWMVAIGLVVAALIVVDGLKEIRITHINECACEQPQEESNAD